MSLSRPRWPPKSAYVIRQRYTHPPRTLPWLVKTLLCKKASYLWPASLCGFSDHLKVSRNSNNHGTKQTAIKLGDVIITHQVFQIVSHLHFMPHAKCNKITYIDTLHYDLPTLLIKLILEKNNVLSCHQDSNNQLVINSPSYPTTSMSVCNITLDITCLTLQFKTRLLTYLQISKFLTK